MDEWFRWYLVADRLGDVTYDYSRVERGDLVEIVSSKTRSNSPPPSFRIEIYRMDTSHYGIMAISRCCHSLLCRENIQCIRLGTGDTSATCRYSR